MCVRRTVAAGLALLCAGAVGTARAEEPPQLALSIETPEPDAVIGDPGGMGFIAGQALAHFGELETFDIMFVIDQSASTSDASGSDIDGDGVVGERRADDGALALFGHFLPLTDDDDNVLAAELAAVETLLDQLDPRTTRVGVVGFAGDGDPRTTDAIVYAPLGSDYARARSALEEIRSAGPEGRTNMMAAVRLAALELVGSDSAVSEPREGAHRIVLFLTDGRPTLPDEVSMHQNRRHAIQAATRAARLGVRIDTFAIGTEALSDPTVTIEMARVSEGVFTPVMSPGDLQAVFENVSFSEIRTLEVTNRTHGEAAAHLSRGADGSYSALVPLKSGANELEVYARASDGREQRRRVTVRFREEAGVQQLSSRLRSARNRLLEQRLADLRRRRVDLRTSLEEEARRALEVDVEQAKDRRGEERVVRVEPGGRAYAP